MGIRWVRDTPARDLTLALGDAISDRTTVVCVSAVQYATGSQVDVAALAARARDVGARVVADVTQMAGAAPVTMTHWGVDALVCSGCKGLSAPAGVALLAVTGDLAAATPVIVGWKGSATPFGFTPQELSLAADARRFELSTMSYSAAVGLLTSIKLLTGIGLTAISEHASRLAADLAGQIAPLGWTPYRVQVSVPPAGTSSRSGTPLPRPTRCRPRWPASTTSAPAPAPAASGYPCTPTTAVTTSAPSPTRSPPLPHARRPALPA